MITSNTNAALSAPRQQLVREMQRVNFGYIKDLRLRAGEPIFDPAPQILCDLKIGGDFGARPELTADDFLLRRQVIELFEHFDRIRDGKIASLEIKHGLPFKLLFEQSPRTEASR